jgi:phosphoribosylglycinamide formyltransferase-1
MHKRVVILISGRGSNMVSLVEACRENDFPADVVGVISDRAEALGLDIASSMGIETRAITRAEHPTKQAMEDALDRELRRLDADIICLAGYMRLLSPGFTDAWAGKLLNVHPSLLPLFKGLDTHQRALDAGMRLHGCSVHFVTGEMDGGPIIAQGAVPVLPDDDVAALAARVLKVEHELYPMALRLVAGGKARFEDGRAMLSGVSATGTLLSPGSASDEIDIESLARMTP